ncbi:hypothetical protein PHYBOEH_000689 [Phytophthora boehmeriae]|uniref:rRNA biogenesis protein RRP5 n=1 Tax=Phytophthora boehmeriae TaxID=109152 RepID=A0A8T1X0J1_9STRA|nr:hypothetical protein PHYBOEH_000689 [Phytophthora boehmeriae]
MAAAATSFPRGKKPRADQQRKPSVAAPGESLFGKRGLAATAATEEQQPKHKKAKKTVAKQDKSAADDLKAAKATLLTFKSLRKGMLLLGCVRQVADGQSLMISLPNKLNGTVALDECSDEFHSFIQQQIKQKKAKTEQDQEQEQLPALSAIFHVGQFVPCVVLATGKADKHKQIHLSLRTSLLHAELSPSTLAKGTALHATVSSVEDHGAIVNLGIRGVNAFVPRKELSDPVQKGQHMLVNVLSMNTHTSTATVTPDRSQVVKAVTRGDSFTLKQLVPGMLLNIRVEDVLENGLSVTFLTFFSATVEQNHMSLPCQQGWETSYRKGLKGRARIVSIDYISKQITLSMAPHIVHLQVPESPFAVGDIVEGASIERIDAGVGMLLSLKDKASNDDDDDVEMEDANAKKVTTNANWKAFAPGYVHISNVSDKHLDKLEKKFSVGSSVKCRVTGFAPFDAVVTVNCKESSLSQAVLRHKDLKPGSKVKGKILSVEKWGILLEVSEGVRGLVQTQHMPPFLLKSKKADTSGKYKVGKTVHARVLYVDTESNRTMLTMKSALLTSELPALSSYEEAKMNFITHGFITKIAEYGVIVTFYNNVYGLVPMALLQQAGIENLEEAYVMGQVVKARVTRCDVSKKRLMLSFDTTSSTISSTKPTVAPETSSKMVGTTITNVKVTDVEATCFRVQTADGMQGIVPFVQLTDFPRQTSLVDELVKQFSVGDVIEEPLLVVSQESDGVLTLSKKPLLLEYASRPSIVPRIFGDVKENAVLIGYVTSVNATKGVFVKFLNNLVAVAPKGYLKEQFVSQIEDGMFEIGETVSCSVEKIVKETKQFIVGFQRSNILKHAAGAKKSHPSFFEAYLREQAAVISATKAKMSPFALGKTEKAEFVGVRPYGAVFALEKNDDTFTVVVPSVTKETNEWDEGDTVKVLLTDYDFSKQVYYGATDDPQASDVLQFGVTQLCDFWCPSQTSTQLGIEVGASVKCRVVSPSLKSAGSSTPFDDLVLLALEDDSQPAKKGATNLSGKSLPKYRPEDLKLGKVLTGRITGISEMSMEIHLHASKKIGKIRAVVSIVDVDGVSEASGHSHPFDKYSVNTSVTGRAIAVVEKGANKLKPVSDENPAKFRSIHLSLRADDLAENGDDDVQRYVRPDWMEGSAGRALLEEGNSIEGVVTEQSADSLNVKLSSSVTGTLSCVEVSTNDDVVRTFQDKFPVGKRVKCFVLQVDDEKKSVELSLIHSSSAQLTASLAAGSIVNGVISPIKSVIRPPSIMVQIGARTYGRVCITELLAKWENKMLALPQFAAGSVVRCVVLSTNNGHIDLSLREDALADPKEYIKATSKTIVRNVGDLVPAIVATTTSSGCFVRVNRNTTARVMLRDLSDDFVKDPQSQFPAGKLVAGRVTKKSERGLELSLKTSIVSEDASLFKWSDLREGLTVKGTITKVQSYGVFVKIEKSTISGLCHISEVADDKVTQPLEQIFSEGDYVKAKSALQVNHPKRVYLHLVDLYARADEHEDVKQTLATMQKKFRTSKQTWIRALQYLVSANKFAEAAETLQRSLKSLAAHKHLPVILKYGQLLYEHGELDKARTIFEGILANYPKRMDLWNVYLDKEIKFGDAALVRALFERLLAMEFSAKKMKFLFKKYLQFEQEQGDDDRVEHVKQLAKDFVASAAAK